MPTKISSKFRRFLCAMVSVVLIMQMFSFLSMALPMTEIRPGDSLKVTLSEDESKIFVFNPVSSGSHDFYSSGDIDTHVYLYNEEKQLGGATRDEKKKNSVLSNDDGAGKGNFLISYNFSAGKTYYFEVMIVPDTPVGSFTVTLSGAHECADNDVDGFCDFCGKQLCEHKETKIDGIKQADCVNDGYTGDTVCVKCGLTVKSGDVIRAFGHDNGQWVTVSQATPDKAGVEELRCTRCSAVLDTRTFSHTHDFELIKTVKPTCTQQGYTEYRCRTCMFVKQENIIPANGHTEKTTETSASCTNSGGRKTICTVCGTVLKEETYPALGHDFSSWEILREPSCTVAGEKVSVCSRCNERNGSAVEIPANGHSFSEYVFNREPTCTKSGEKVSTCKVCGEQVTETVDAYGHSFTEWETTKIASCTETGVRTRKCTRCGEQESEEVAQSHSFSDWQTTKEASCTVKGERTRQCVLCGFVEEEVIEYGHEFSEWIGTEPTCTSAGTKTRSCRLCGQTETQTTEALGHSFDEWTQTKAASCSVQGEEKRTCSRCAEEETRAVQTTPHVFSSWQTVSDSTCVDAGSRERNCLICNLLEREILPAKGHTLVKDITRATTDSDGKSVSSCAVCGFVESENIIKKIDADTVALSKTLYAYDEKEHKPAVEIRNEDGESLKENKDYQISGLSSKKAIGTYTVKIKFIGDYSGSKTLKFDIKPNKVSSLSYTRSVSSVKLKWKAVKGATGYRIFKYDSKSKEYKKVADTSKTSYTVKELNQSTKYYFKVQPYTKVSDKSTLWASQLVKITAYTAPSVPSVTLKAGNDKITVKTGKQSGIKGFEIYLKTGENGEYKKKATTADNSKTVKASSGKTCYVKVRAYRWVDGEKVYSKFSKAKKVKVK